MRRACQPSCRQVTPPLPLQLIETKDKWIQRVLHRVSRFPPYHNKYRHRHPAAKHSIRGGVNKQPRSHSHSFNSHNSNFTSSHPNQTLTSLAGLYTHHLTQFYLFRDHPRSQEEKVAQKLLGAAKIIPAVAYRGRSLQGWQRQGPADSGLGPGSARWFLSGASAELMFIRTSAATVINGRLVRPTTTTILCLSNS